jgi:hypothetical protein
MKKILFGLCLFCAARPLMAQTSPTTPYTPMSNYVQPSPNVAAMGKYVDYPIGYFTGTPQINIPLYDLKDNAINLPISLSYHPSGIRVSETASWAGLGWTLNATGMIARSIRGAPDEGSKVSGTGTPPHGYYVDSGITKLALLPYPTNGVIPSRHDSTYMMQNYTVWQVSAGATDGEPDLFTYTCNGHSGKFVFDEHRTPRSLTDDNSRISVNWDAPNHTFASWTITTPEGVVYYFGENNMHEVTGVIPMPGNGQPEPNTTVPSSWFLTRIVYPNSKDTVFFNYTPETYSYFDLAPESQLLINSISPDCFADVKPIGLLKTTITGLRLTSIVTTNYKVLFIAKTPRQDLISSPNELDSVKVFNAQNQCIVQFLLSYGYFTSTATNNFSTSQNSQLNGDVTDTKRLKLLAVTEYSGDGLTSKPPYSLTYQESQQLPRRMSYDQDHWGYSNNFNGNMNDRFMPSVSLPNHCVTMPFGANRNPRWPDMQAFSINTIRDPLGATTAFTFEAHTAGNQYTTSNMVGGLRIHQIVATDSVTGKSQIRLFNYGSGGNLYHAPQYLIVPDNEYYFVSYDGPMPNTTYRGYSHSYTYMSQGVILSVLKQSQSIVPMQDYQGNQIGYPRVQEIYGANGEGGSKIYWYASDPPARGNSRLDISNFTTFATVANGTNGPTSGLLGNGHFNDILPQNLVYYMGYMVFDYYPYAPAQVDCSSGQLLQMDTYDSVGNLVRSSWNRYSEVDNENYWMRGFKAYRASFTGPQPQYTVFNYDAMTYYKLHTGISHLASSGTTEYKDGKAMATSNYYGYESALHSLRTSETTVNSIGDSIVSKTYYSFDYANSATTDNVFGKMRNRNLLTPISTRVWKNNQLLSGTITQYKDFASASPDTLINPARIYSLETTTPLTVAQAGESIALTGQFGALIPNSNFIEKADFNYSASKGRIIEQKLVNNKNQAMIWDNVAALPLAQVDDAYFADIAYCSFETTETGNWTLTPASIVTDATAPTGTHGYALGSSNPISKTGMTSTSAYIVSYWLKTGASITITGGSQSNSLIGLTLNGWTYHEVSITGTTSISITGSGNLDELRLYPSGGRMTSYTYDPLLRLIAQCSPTNTISYYEYDGLNRLVDIKDQYGNIVKAFEYNYGRQSRASH